MLPVYALPSHDYFIQMSIVDFDKQIILIGKLATYKCIFGYIDQNTIGWMALPSNIEIALYGPHLGPSSWF